MTDYSPPNTFYSQTYGLFENEDMYKFIGKGGAHFKFLTTKLGIDYIWWKKETNIIELWGPHQKLEHAKNVMNEKLAEFIKKRNENLPGLQRCDAATLDELKVARILIKDIL